MKIMSVNNQSINNQTNKAPAFKGLFKVVEGLEHLSPEEAAALPAITKKFEQIGLDTDTFFGKFGKFDTEYEGDHHEGCVWGILPIKIEAEISGIPITMDLTQKKTVPDRFSYISPINKWLDKVIAHVEAKKAKLASAQPTLEDFRR